MDFLEYWTLICIDIMQIDCASMHEALEIIHGQEDFEKSEISKDELLSSVLMALNRCH